MKHSGMKASRCGVRPPRLREHKGRRGALVVPEEPLGKLIDDWLELAGIRFVRTEAKLTVAKGASGERSVRASHVRRSWPDRTLLLPLLGRFGVIEIKAEDGSFRPGQKELVDDLRADGAWVLVPRSLDEVVWALVEEYKEAGLWKAARLDKLRRAVAAYERGAGAR